PQLVRDERFVEMFLDEAVLTARLRHPNVVQTLDIVSTQDELLIVMEYVEGESLARLLHTACRANRSMPVPVAAAIAHDVLLGLHHAHEAMHEDGRLLAIVHRDLSPHNVLVGVDGLARVLDFGVAKATGLRPNDRRGEFRGKIPYMAPEQIVGEPVD